VDQILAVDLTGTFTSMQLAVPDMIADGWGRIVTISSFI
jgi:2-hydroxycyclohexanecarboxyl-CoA dehydrogenase